MKLTDAEWTAAVMDVDLVSRHLPLGGGEARFCPCGFGPSRA